ncbi:MAG: enoyl-CoA hydratase/isomerase family protein [Gemmatimonadetes bacterium]|nr:enoyl-CoA hydratase/isomerase family protein [Gemmatimonadota bacterium]MBI3568342.1 enoyl-CoA hydratase/isomerase family protein [Gemmatimonadota bacterium]
MAYDLLLLDVADRVATVTVNRPDKLNALNDQVMGELESVFAELASRDDVGVIILTGSGRAFVAGADIKAIAARQSAELGSMARHGQSVFRAIERSTKPVIAAVNGFALGGGCELALACHLRVASAQAKFGLPEVTLGLIPGYGGTQRLARLVGRGRALELILTGLPIDGAEAHRIGLANAVVAPEALLDTARSFARAMLKNGPVAMARAIAAVDGGLDRTLDEGLALEAQLFGSLGDTADMREGTAAFLAKRPAGFTGK